tara:strand:+ start:5252 stop:5515 length:264 start_codon:yes stop_codon:yes gene_type:complete
MTAKGPKQVAVVKWLDIEDCTSSEWVSQRDAKRDAKKPFAELRSVGFVVYEDEDRICLVSTWGPDTSGVLKIPKGVCQSIDRVDCPE